MREKPAGWNSHPPLPTQTQKEKLCSAHENPGPAAACCASLRQGRDRSHLSLIQPDKKAAEAAAPATWIKLGEEVT